MDKISVIVNQVELSTELNKCHAFLYNNIRKNEITVELKRGERSAARVLIVYFDGVVIQIDCESNNEPSVYNSNVELWRKLDFVLEATIGRPKTTNTEEFVTLEIGNDSLIMSMEFK